MFRLEPSPPHLCWLCSPLLLSAHMGHSAPGFLRSAVLRDPVPCLWVCWWGCCVPVGAALLRVGLGALGSDFASGPGSGPQDCVCSVCVCALGRVNCVYVHQQCLWATGSVAHVSPLSCLFKTCLRFLNPVEREAGLPLPLPAAPLPPDLVSDVCISEVLLENKEAGGWICVRWSQTMPVTARPPPASSAGFTSSLRCLPTNWE